MRYIATINGPGYLPTDGEMAVFNTAQEAWEWLASERKRQEDDVPSVHDCVYSDDYGVLRALGDGDTDPLGIDPSGFGSDLTGTVYGVTPGYDGDHDPGLAYHVFADTHASPAGDDEKVVN